MNTTVAIIGSGLIGRSWGIVFSRAGWTVRLYDPVADARDAAIPAIRTGLEELKAYGLFDGDVDAALSRVSVHGDLGEALSGASYVQENGPEQVGRKRELFAEMDRLAEPDAILATSSSGLKISSVADHCEGRHRCLVAHPINPPHLVPCVEVSPAEWTDPAVTAETRRIMADVGQSPMVVKKEIDGFIVNRLQGALLNEALRLAAGGYADPDDIDICVRDGLGLRWSFMGPFETIDLNAPQGIADYGARFGPMYTAMAAEQATAPSWGGGEMAALDTARRAILPLDKLGERSAWRNRRLVALAAHRREMADKD